MRHRNAGRKFTRSASHRRAMFRNLAGNLILHEQVETTEPKAKELRRVVERLITKAARLGDDLTKDVGKIKSDEERERVLSRRLSTQRQVAAFLPKTLARVTSDGDIEEVDLVYKLFHELAPRYLARIKAGKGGGYTRTIKMGHRRGDSAPMALISLIEGDSSPTPTAKDAEGAKAEAKDRASKKPAQAAAAPAEEVPEAPKKKSRAKKAKTETVDE